MRAQKGASFKKFLRGLRVIDEEYKRREAANENPDKRSPAPQFGSPSLRRAPTAKGVP